MFIINTHLLVYLYVKFQTKLKSLSSVTAIYCISGYLFSGHSVDEQCSIVKLKYRLHRQECDMQEVMLFCLLYALILLLAQDNDFSAFETVILAKVTCSIICSTLWVVKEADCWFSESAARRRLLRWVNNTLQTAGRNEVDSENDENEHENAIWEQRWT